MKTGATFDNTDVIVVGGGIAGLANAQALARLGRTVRVLEAAPSFSEVGAGLQLAPNATRILREWGLLDQVIAAGVLPRRLVLRDALDGGELTHLDLGPRFVARYGTPYVVIHRSDLLDVLYEACQKFGVDLRPGSYVDALSVSDSTVAASVGDSLYHADVAIAADGLHSTFRDRFSDDEPICAGFVAYRGTIPVEELDDQSNEVSPDDVVVYIGPGCHFVQYLLRGGEILNQVAVFSSPAYWQGKSDWGGPQELDAAFSGACAAVRRGLSSLWRDRHWPMFDRVPMSRWQDGHVALTGDAAHPMLQYLAQGACQSIEDARSLERHAAASASWPAALHAYESDRVAHAARVQETARSWGELWHCDGLTRTLRNHLLRAREPDDLSYVDWLYGEPSTDVNSARH